MDDHTIRELNRLHTHYHERDPFTDDVVKSMRDLYEDVAFLAITLKVLILEARNG